MLADKTLLPSTLAYIPLQTRYLATFPRSRVLNTRYSRRAISQNPNLSGSDRWSDTKNQRGGVVHTYPLRSIPLRVSCSRRSWTPLKHVGFHRITSRSRNARSNARIGWPIKKRGKTTRERKSSTCRLAIFSQRKNGERVFRDEFLYGKSFGY